MRIQSSAAAASSPSTRVALYTRVSTDLQARADEGSLETQEQRLRSAVAARSGPHEVVGIYREEGVSGKSLDRPALRRLLADVEAGRVSMVMVTRIDRLSRSLLDFFELYRLFEAHGVQVFSLNESFDTSTPMGRAMLKIVLTFAELEREQTAERTRVALLARAQRGIWNGGHPVLGYDSDGSGHLEIVEEEAAVVRKAFELMLELHSPRQVAIKLNAQGHRQKRYTSRRRGDVGARPFTLAVVRGMLQNRLYLGEVRHRGEFFPGQHDAIVDGPTFDRVQELLAANRKGARPPSVATEHHYLLTGLVRCGSCGRALTSGTSWGRSRTYPYYRCTSVTKRVDVDCQVRGMPAGVLEDAVLAVVREAAKDPELLQEATAEAERIAREEVEPARERIQQIRTDLARVRDEGRRTLDAITTAGVSDSGFARDRLHELDERRAQLEQALAEEEGRIAVAETQHLDSELVAQALRDFDLAYEYLNPGERTEFIQQMVDQVVVYPDHIEVALYEGSHASVGIEQALKEARKKSRKSKAKTGNKGGSGSGSASGSGAEGGGGGNGHRKANRTAPSTRGVNGDGERFAVVVDWLPSVDHRQNPGSRGSSLQISGIGFIVYIDV